MSQVEIQTDADDEIVVTPVANSTNLFASFGAVLVQITHPEAHLLLQELIKALHPDFSTDHGRCDGFTCDCPALASVREIAGDGGPR